MGKHRTAVFVAIISSFIAHSSAYALYVRYEGIQVTWSNTRLGGGPFQPAGWVQVPDVPAGFTGDIFAPDFISVSSPVVYGTYETLIWEPEYLHDASKVSFKAGVVTDINLVYIDSVNERLLVIAGPPTPHAVLVNTPQPPCTHWPGLKDLDFCGARVAITLTTTTSEPLLDAQVTIPPIPKRGYDAKADVQIKGSLKFNAQGGLFFDAEYARLNRHGPYLLTATLEWKIQRVKEPSPRTERVWFTKVDIKHKATGRTTDGQQIKFIADDDYWVLGEPLSWKEMKSFTLENLSEFCAGLDGIGLCRLRGDFARERGTLAFGVFANLPASTLAEVSGNFLLDLSQTVGLAQLDTNFSGGLSHRAVTVPILEAQE